MGKVTPDTSVVTFYRRSLTPADSEIIPAGVNSPPALDSDAVDIDEGQWVTLDTDGKAVKVGATATANAFVVWVGRRTDAGAARQLTVIFGTYIAKTTEFKSTDTYEPGTYLVAKNARLEKALTGEPVVGIAEGAPAGATVEYPNGYLPYNTQFAGGFAP